MSKHMKIHISHLVLYGGNYDKQHHYQMHWKRKIEEKEKLTRTVYSNEEKRSTDSNACDIGHIIIYI